MRIFHSEKVKKIKIMLFASTDNCYPIIVLFSVSFPFSFFMNASQSNERIKSEKVKHEEGNLLIA